MIPANGYNPLRWDCVTRGCFNLKRRPKIEVFVDCFPGRINFGDVDGIVEINGNALLLEWKSEAHEVPTGQRILYERLTHSGLCSAMIIVGDAETMSRADEGRSEWRPIPGWPEYEVSEFGDIRRVEGSKGTRSGHLRRPWINKQTGYLQVCLWRNNRGMKTTVHRLVALSFLGEPPSADHVVAHNDGRRVNNHWTNLRWATLRENAADTFLHGTHNRGSRNGQAKIDEVCVSAIRKMHAMQIPRRVAAEGFGLGRQTIDGILNGKRWGHVR